MLWDYFVLDLYSFHTLALEAKGGEGRIAYLCP